MSVYEDRKQALDDHEFQMGLERGRLAVTLDVLTDALVLVGQHGVYCQSARQLGKPAMDIQIASNFERLYFEAVKREATETARAFKAFAGAGRIDIPPAAHAEMKSFLVGQSVSEDETRRTILSTLNETGELIDPHTAVGVAVAEKETRDAAVPMVVLGTAHAAKFPDAVEAACGVRPPLPEWLGDLHERPERMTALGVDQGAVERHILSASRAAREGAAA